MSAIGQPVPAFDESRLNVPRALVAYAGDYPAGHRTGRHHHRRHQFVHAIGGVMTVDTEVGRWVVPPNFGVWVPAGMPHELTMHGKVALRTLYIEPAAQTDFGQACGVRQVPPLLRELILRAMKLPSLYDKTGKDGRLVAILLDEVADSPEAPLHLPWPEDARAARVAGALQDSPEDGRTLTQWARRVGAGERTLARLFARETGLGFRAWRRRLRLLHALRRLAEGTAVTTIALDCGYQSVSAFVATFRREFGVSPGRYLTNIEKSGS
ncbi:AraC family transcriptional regulator [Ferruginivarius sediminum]|uniref:AraC family transcriptional regulator n=1 Tax=Ferruginivarius sediminum TaxID=2661937 RepID=A0A369TH34_9PROT|nr:helix-turn-helix transcriptional regulator [Ferruginivarius sediminum]RDD63685.1 AraC family transcriptional regulator [Ferruginivarius sediminum]